MIECDVWCGCECVVGVVGVECGLFYWFFCCGFDYCDDWYV